MLWFRAMRGRYAAGSLVLAGLWFLMAWPGLGTAQDVKDPATDTATKHIHPDKADSNKDLVDQIKLLQAKVARLEAAVAKIAPPTGGGGGMGMMNMEGMMGGKKGMGGMGGGSGMGMMDMDGMMGGKKKGMGGMSDGSGMGMMDMDGMGGGSGAGMMMDDMDMMGMGSMGGAKGKKMKMTAALPGFPGASHIYHIGATDFYLDHPEHITLSTEQMTKLSQMKQKATMEKATAQRKIEEAEQQLWELTAAEQPDAAKIEAKLREIEKLRGDQRMAFIRAVGEAAQVLTDEQRVILLGNAQHATTPDPHVHPKTP